MSWILRQLTWFTALLFLKDKSCLTLSFERLVRIRFPYEGKRWPELASRGAEWKGYGRELAPKREADIMDKLVRTLNRFCRTRCHFCRGLFGPKTSIKGDSGNEETSCRRSQWPRGSQQQRHLAVAEAATRFKNRPVIHEASRRAYFDYLVPLERHVERRPFVNR